MLIALDSVDKAIKRCGVTKIISLKPDLGEINIIIK